jgi:copper homeostasis protein CutC
MKRPPKSKPINIPPARARPMNDDMEVQLEDLAADEIAELLQEAGAELSLEQVEQLTRLVAQAGGLDGALEVLAQLEQLRRAA